MPVQIGAKPEHGFDQPLGLLSDCHRRIERFLEVMVRVLERTGGGPMDGPQRDALEAALRYFAAAAPRHTEDEERSLFPRLRASDDPAAREAMRRIDALEDDHRRAGALHAEAGRLCRAWLDAGALGPAGADRLRQLLDELRQTYARHIAVEDQEVFPLAGRVLGKEDLAQVGIEMARRRGLDQSITAGATRTTDGD
jgi:hemerythrin-like domain-containing protein